MFTVWFCTTQLSMQGTMNGWRSDVACKQYKGQQAEHKHNYLNTMRGMLILSVARQKSAGVAQQAAQSCAQSCALSATACRPTRSLS